MEASFRQFQKIISFLFISILSISLTVYAEENEKPNPYKAAYDELMHLSVNPAKVAKVNSYIFQRDEATFVLSDGELFLCNPVQGENCAAIFIGQGTFAFTPPTTIEQDQLARFTEKKSVSQKISMMFMVFSDSTYQELLSSLTFEPGENTKNADHEIRKCLKELGNDNRDYFNSDILRTLLEHDHSGLFYAHVEDPGWEFTVNPYAEEEVQLYINKNDFFEQVVKYPRLQSAKTSIVKNMINISGYTLDCAIEDNHALDITAEGTIVCTMNVENPKWLNLWLYSDLVADSVTWDHGKKLTSWSKKNNPNIWIKFDTVLHKGDTCSLQVYYHGRVLKKIDEYGWIGLEASDEWYPQYADTMSATFDVTYHYPSRYKLASIGECVSIDTTDEVTTSRWVEKKPIHYASFNLGLFEELTLKNDSIPEVDLLYSTTGKAELRQLFAQFMILSAGDMEPRIAEEVQQSAKFFQTIFGGEYPFKKLYVTQVPYRHGISFPGLIHLSWTAFQFKNRDLDLSMKEGSLEVFCAHEVAHQWLGNGVEVQSYHDAWLSEAIANYCGLLFMQQVVKDNDKFFDMLEGWKDDIFTNRKFLFGNGQEAGPIWLGSRTESYETAGDYSVIVYEKGAWVLHMLRNMLLDLKTMKEDRFNEILRDFYTTYKGKRASTDDFKTIVEKHIGGKMDWFFDEWVYNTGIPKYTFAYKTEKVEDGKYKVSCKVQTEGVDENFQMFVPLYIDFGNGKFVRLRAVVKGTSTQFDLPFLPLEPEKITFNDLESVLCEVKTADWEDIK